MANRVPRSAQGSSLLGRESECALLDELVAAIRRGESRSLLLWGEAGIGKTALLEHLVESASDLMVVRAVGVESEMELPYASLHQLCASMLDRLSRLPAPQRDALEIVFGSKSGVPPDRFVVALAALGLFSKIAEERPLLCVVDDAQWLDRASALTLGFVARRLLAEPVGLVFAARQRDAELASVAELEVCGLRNGDARTLLGTALRFGLDEQVRDRIVAETRGNPLALLELPRGLTAMQLAGGLGILGTQTLGERIEESFVRRLEALSDPARRLLVVAAAEPLGEPTLVLRAAEQLGIAVTGLDAETDGLLAIGERVIFRHPLVRSAAYRSADDIERRAVHLALAEATDREADPDRRAWHRALATAGVDEEVAIELERSAGRAQGRGGVAAAAAFLQRAVVLSEHPARRAERALAAAQASLQAGAFDAALRLLAAAEAEGLDEFQLARADLVRGRVAFASGLGGDAPQLLLKAATQLVPFDLELARENYLTAWGAAAAAGQLAAGDVLTEICRSVRGLPRRSGTPSPLDLLLDGLALLITDGHAAATPTLRRAAKSLVDISADDVLHWMANAACTAVWDDEGMLTICARQVKLVRDAGVLEQLPAHLSALALATAWEGDFAGAASLVAEADSIAAATGNRFPPYAALRLLALRGREAQTAAAIASAIEQAVAGGRGLAATTAHWAAAVLYNGLARYEEGARAAQQTASDTLLPWTAMWALPELVEAAVHNGDAEVAHDALERLAQTTQPSGTDWALGTEARCRALLSDGAAADDLYQEAIERLGRTRLRPELARAQLLYGEWLRREQRRIDARAHLRAAYEAFASIGMDGFAERTRRELVATGETIPRRTVENRDALTAQERQIAEMASDGLSSPEIAARLFLSPRTVEWHLRKVFGKLGIHRRRELAKALDRRDSESHPA